MKEGRREGGREGGREGLLTEVHEDGGEEEEVEHEDGGCQDAAHDALCCPGKEGGREGRREGGREK